MGMLGIWSRFGRDERGNVAVIFAAVLVPVIGILAAALDYGQASKVREQLQAASDGAAQAISVKLDLDREALTKLVRVHLAANLPDDLAALPFELVLPADRTSVEIRLGTRVPTSLLGLVGVSQIEVAATGFSRPPVARPDPLRAPVETAPRAPDEPGSLRKAWRDLVGAGPQPGLPAPEEVRKVQEAVTRALEAALPEGGSGRSPRRIESGEELRRAAHEIARELRDMGPAGGIPPPDLERLMRQLPRH